jgi:hypothetical protein
MAKLNKKVLCFIDEHGTAGEPGFALGAVLVWAHACGKCDKAFSDILPSSVNEVHASQWSTGGLQSILALHAQTITPNSVLMINKLGGTVGRDRPEVYANALIDTVKVGLKLLSKAQRISKIGNVDIITDVNDQNSHRNFDLVIERARKQDGLFKAVNRVVCMDSAASRMLQLADVVAYSRTWINNGEENAKGLRNKYGIALI